jgi:hypothetical protein
MSNPKKSGGSFLRELKRRKVAQSSFYYIVVCWVALQVADFVFPAIGVDADQGSRVLLYIAVLGFPVNFALAWYFQMTSRGVTRTTTFVERRVLRNMAPINDQRHSKVSNYVQKEQDQDFGWIISAETGPLTGLSFGVPGPIVVGRSLECDIAVVSPHVSRRHACLDLEDGQLMVEDLGSSNGTVVNGKAIQERHPLHHEDEVRFHDIIFRVTESYSGHRQENDSMSQTTFIDTNEPTNPTTDPTTDP